MKQPEIIREELPHVSARREAAGFEPAAGSNDERLAEARRNLVGLALSGGGVRSASFNLGVLQALYRKGLLRFVDYLSTVSGGGYIGAFFSSRVRQAREPIYDGDAKPVQPNAKVGEDLGMLPQKNARPPRAIRDLIRGGEYLNHPLLFVNRYLFGLALNNIAILSLLICISAGIAWVWRSFDFIRVRWAISDSLTWLTAWLPTAGTEAIGLLANDAGICFLPAVVAFLLWLGGWSLAIGLRNAMPRTSELLIPRTKYLLFIAGLFVLIGFAVVLSNGDISFGAFGTDVTGHRSVLWPLGIIGLLCLLPVLRPWRLLGSGQSPRSTVDTFIFRLSSMALLVGVPLWIIYVFAHENISGYGTHGVDDIKDWKGFIEQVRKDKDAGRWPGTHIFNQLGPRQEEIVAMREKKIVRVQPKLSEDVPHWEYMINGMADIQQLNKDLVELKKKEIKSFQDFFAEGDLSPTVGILQTTHYPYIVKRRQMVIRAANRAIDEQWFALGFIDQNFGPSLSARSDLRAAVLAAAALSPGWSGASPLMLLSSSRLPSKFDGWLIAGQAALKKSEEEGLKALGAAVEEATAFRRAMEKKQKDFLILVELLRKYDYLSHNYDKAAEFQKEFEKLEFRRELGRRLLAHAFPQFIPAGEAQIKRVVVIDRDQRSRGWWAFWAFLVFIAALFIVNLNITSLHGFYRDQLADAYIAGGNTLKMNALADNTAKGAPYHLVVATLVQYLSVWKAMFGQKARQPGAAEELPPTDAFLFTPHFCGSDSTGFRSTGDYTVNQQVVSLADAMAISGAAVTPLQVRNPLIRVLMMVLNLRLGQWLPNPGNPLASAQRPNIWRVLFGNLLRQPKKRSLCFVTDGGHHENLGIWPLLQRRCYLIVVADASQDSKHVFEDFIRLCRRARLEEGVHLVELASDRDGDVPFQLHPLRLRPDGPGAESRYLRSLAARFSNKHYILARIKYPPAAAAPGQPQNGQPAPPPGPDEGYLVYLKSSLTGDEDNDLVGFSFGNNEFPHDATSNVVFDEDQVESYRQLGYHIADGLCRDLNRALTPLGGSGAPGPKAVPPLPPSSDGPRSPGASVAAQPATVQPAVGSGLWGFTRFDIRGLVERWIAATRREEQAKKTPGLRDMVTEFVRRTTPTNGQPRPAGWVIPAPAVQEMRLQIEQCLVELAKVNSSSETLDEVTYYLEQALEIFGRHDTDLHLTEDELDRLRRDRLAAALLLLRQVRDRYRATNPPRAQVIDQACTRVSRVVELLDAGVQGSATA